MSAGPVSAAALVEDARRSAGSSQRSLARRAGVTQSVVSAYETGAREPSLATLIRLVRATGGDLDIKVIPGAGRLDRLTGPVGVRVRHGRHEVVAAARSHGVTNVRVFGSVARGEDRADSDLDLLVQLPAGAGLLAVARLSNELAQILSADVDLVPDADLKPNTRADIEKDAVPL